jgi:hypothetical protein
MLTALVNNEINCSICSNLLLKHLGMCCNRVDPLMEWEDIGTENKVYTYCLNVMVRQYIIVVLEYHGASNVERLLLHNRVIRAKHRWQKAITSAIEEEKYLGVDSFASDLSKSCGEFH